MGFFDDLSKKASETYRNTAEKTNKLTREMKLKSLINEDKGKIEKIYAEIGKKVYEKHIREENIDIKSELIEECSKIDAYAKEIEDMNTEMRALKDLRLCTKCGSEIPLSARFCPKCGAQQEEIKPVETVNNTEVPTEAKEVVEQVNNEVTTETVQEVTNEVNNEINNEENDGTNTETNNENNDNNQ